MTRTSTEPPARIVALAADMIFAAKIRGTADALGIPVRVITAAARLPETVAAAGPAMVIVDLDTRALDIAATIAAVRSSVPQAEILAYVSHVRTDAIEAARSAGARVLARSAFTRTLPEILKRAGTKDNNAGAQPEH